MGQKLPNDNASWIITRSLCPTDAMTKRRIYRKLQIGTAECTGNVHGINRVLSCTCKALLRQEIHLTLADAKATGGDR